MRPLRVRLVCPSFTSELVEFLRRCQCRVSHVGGGLIHVDLRPDVSHEMAACVLQRERCYFCGVRLEDILQQLGSLACMDCRDRPNGDVSANVERDAASHSWARLELASFLRIWNAKHPEASAELLE